MTSTATQEAPLRNGDGFLNDLDCRCLIALMLIGPFHLGCLLILTGSVAGARGTRTSSGSPGSDAAEEPPMPPRWIIGLASGASADEVDAALLEVEGAGLDMRPRLAGSLHQPYGAELGK